MNSAKFTFPFVFPTKAPGLNQFCLQFRKGRLLVPREIEDKSCKSFQGKTVDEDPAAGQRWRKEI